MKLRRVSAGLGDLPENWQNILFPAGTPNTNYQDALSGADFVTSGTYRFMRDLASKGYPNLPLAGPLDQYPGTIPSEIPSVYLQKAPVVVQNTAPPPILIATTDDTTPPSPPPPPPIYVPTAPVSSSRGPRASLQGLSGIPDSQRTAFPRQIRGISVTGNIFWYKGAPVLNRGVPVWSNDANEFLRHAMVESNWDDVEYWLAWAIANGYPQESLHLIEFGRYKYSQDATSGRIYYPFSSADYETFFNRFLKYASAVPADQDCIRNKLSLYRRAVASNPRNQFSLRLSDCPLTTGWALGLLKAVAVIAIPYAIATAATALAAVGTSTAGASAGAAATAGASGASGAAAGGSALAAAGAAATPVIETVVVTASAPTLFGGTALAATAVSAGAIAVTAAPPPISAPTISPAPSAPVIETVITQASALPAISPLATASALTTVAAAPAIFTTNPPPVADAPIETVTVTASQPTSAPIAETLVTGGIAVLTSPPAIISSDAPISVETPETPEIDESLLDKIKFQIGDALESLGADLLKAQLEKFLAERLQRRPTEKEIEFFEEYIDGLTSQPRRISVPPLVSQSNRWIIIAAVIGLVVIILETQDRSK